MSNRLFPHCAASSLQSTLLLLLAIFVAGCGGGDEPESDLDSFYGAGTGDTANGSSDSDGGSTNAGDYETYASAARQAAEYLNGMSSEYESLANSGQSQVELKRTEELYQQLEPVQTQVRNLDPPPQSVATKLKDQVLQSLVDALKRAQIAELHFERNYDVSMMNFGPFGSRGHEISDGIRATRGILDRLQSNLPTAEKLTTGPPPTIGGPPPANRSFGFLSTVSLDGSTYRSVVETASGETFLPWRVTPDPAAHAYEVAVEQELGIEASKLDVQPSFTYVPSNVLYPEMASTFVGLGLNETAAQKREIWDLSKKIRTGIVTKLQMQNSDIMALSPDGRYYAGRPEGAAIIGLFDIESGKPVGQVPFEFESSGEYQLFFGVNNRLVCMSAAGATVWTTPDLSQSSHIEFTSELADSIWQPGVNWSLSPGGRYLAIPGRKSFTYDLTFYDLTNGQASGRITFTGLRHLQYTACGFSPDGRQLAVLAEGPWNTWIQIWSLSEGQITASYTRDAQLSDAVEGHKNYQGPAVEWFPDNRRILLFGKGVFDTSTGQGTRLIPSTVHYRVKPLGGDRVGAIVNREFVAYDLNEIPANPTRWEAESLKNETIDPDDPFAVVSEQGKPLTQRVDRSGIRFISSPTTSIWNVSPDAQPVGPASTFQVNNFTSQNVFHSAVAADQSLAVVGYTNEAPRYFNGQTHNLESLKGWVEFAQPTSTVPERFDFSFPSGLMAVSPSGSKILTQDLDGANRFDLWDIQGKKHIGGLIPYAQGRSDGGAPILWATFIDEERILTASAAQLTCWRVPAGQAVFEIAIDTLTGLPQLSPGRKQLAIVGKDFITVYSTESGELLGFNRELGLSGSLAAVAFRQDGAKLALLSAPNGGGEVAILDVGTGQVESRFPLPLSGKHLLWTSDDFLLIDGAYLVTVQKQAIAWIYQLNGFHVESAPGMPQFFLAKKGYNEPLTLRSTSLPTQETIAAVAAANPPNEVVLTSGGSVALDIQIPQPPGRGSFESEVRQALTNSFAENEITVAPSAVLTLEVRGTQEKTGGAISVGRSMSAFSRGPEIDEERVTWTLTIKRENETLWQRSVSANNTGSFQLEEGVTGQAAVSAAAQQLNEGMWRKASSALLNFKVPKYVFGSDAGTGLGKTQLGE